MPLPMELQHASDDFERFLADARDGSGLATRNQTYTMVEGVLRCFRRRLTVQQALDFADVLPPLLRAIFVSRWDISEPVLPFADRATLTREVQALRQHHNFAPDSCLVDVARALRRHVDAEAFDRVLQTLPDGAADYWQA